MLVTFTCNAYQNITMFYDVAKRLFKMIGYNEAESGVIRSEDTLEVLLRLKKAIEVDKDQPILENCQSDDSKEQTVNIAHRAYPLIEMLEAAAKEKCDVMWETT